MVLSYGFLKLSITYFYRRLFVTRSGSTFDIITKAVLVINAVWTIAFFIAVSLICGTHADANWGSVEDQLVYCSNSLKIDNALVVSDVITDGIVWLLPIPVVRDPILLLCAGFISLYSLSY